MATFFIYLFKNQYILYKKYVRIKQDILHRCIGWFETIR